MEGGRKGQKEGGMGEWMGGGVDGWIEGWRIGEWSRCTGGRKNEWTEGGKNG